MRPDCFFPRPDRIFWSGLWSQLAGPYSPVFFNGLQIRPRSGPDRTVASLVPTLLVFGAYPCITEFDPPTRSTTQRATAIKKAMEEVSRIRTKTQINKALNERNSPSVTDIHDLPLNSPVLVWHEGNTGRSGHWTGPYPLLRTQGETYTVELLGGRLVKSGVIYWSRCVEGLIVMGVVYIGC